MKKKILREYYKNIILAVFLIIVTWLSVSFFLLFSGQSVDMTLPDTLILSFEQYVEIDEQSISISDEGLLALKEHNLWVQVIDDTGKAIFSENAPAVAQDSYTTFDLINYSLMSDRLKGQTIYTATLEDYILIMGASSDVIQKISISVTGMNNDFILSFLLLIIIIVMGVIVAGYFYTNRIAKPLLIITKNISALAENQAVDIQVKKQSIFTEVYKEIISVSEKMTENKKMREQWVSNISHDLKTPLTSIKGYAEVLINEDYTIDKAEVSQYSREILKSESDIEELLNELVLSQKLAEGKIKLDFSEVNLSELLKSCEQEFKAAYRGEISVTLDVEKELTISCDEKYIKRTILNIMHNSVVHNDEKIAVSIKAMQDENGIVIRISDNGKGISDSDLNNIFERYYRGTASQTKKGTGLGLAIAKEIILAHKGSIKAENIPSGGLLFTIKISK